jgi:hypothetical protein
LGKSSKLSLLLLLEHLRLEVNFGGAGLLDVGNIDSSWSRWWNDVGLVGGDGLSCLLFDSFLLNYFFGIFFMGFFGRSSLDDRLGDVVFSALGSSFFRSLFILF